MGAEQIPGQKPFIHRKPTSVIKERESFKLLPTGEKKKVEKWTKRVEEDNFIESTKVGS